MSLALLNLSHTITDFEEELEILALTPSQYTQTFWCYLELSQTATQLDYLLRNTAAKEGSVSIDKELHYIHWNLEFYKNLLGFTTFHLHDDEPITIRVSTLISASKGYY